MTESPYPIKDLSEVVFTFFSAEPCSHRLLSVAYEKVTVLINDLKY